MAELATPTRYNVPVMTQNFQPAPIAPMAVDTRGLAKAQMWGEIAKSIATLPDTLIKSYQLARQRRKDATDEKNQALLEQKFQEASTPSATAVDSPTNKALGVIPGATGGGPNKPALSDFDITPTGMSYKPEDPALKKAKVDYYEAQALRDFGKKTPVGVTFANKEAAIAAGYDPDGAKVNQDGTITVEHIKMREDKGKRLTEGEQKTTTYVKRADAANANLETILKDYDPTHGMGAAETVFNKVPILGNFVVSGNQQKLKQAVDEFATAILRKDTGAAISRAEREEVYKTYVPQPGDQPEVLQQKSIARKRAIDSLRESLPQADQRAAAAHMAPGGAAVITPPPSVVPSSPVAAPPAAVLTAPPTAPAAGSPTVGGIMSAQDTAAVAWVHNHPNDPRTSKIKQVLAAKGIAIN